MKNYFKIHHNLFNFVEINDSNIKFVKFIHPFEFWRNLLDFLTRKKKKRIVIMEIIVKIP